VSKARQPTRRELLRTLALNEFCKGECDRIRDLAGSVLRTVERLKPSPFVAAYHDDIETIAKELNVINRWLRDVYARAYAKEEKADTYSGEDGE
jgi:hypothetical protein